MSRNQSFLYYGEQIWGTCYKCKSACNIFYDKRPKDFESANRIGLCITSDLPHNMPRIVDPKEFDSEKDIVTCFNCVGNVFLTKDDELFRKCPVCLRFFDDSDIDAMGFTSGPWTGTSFDMHKYQCQEKQSRWTEWENQKNQHLQEDLYRRPMIKPKEAFLIRRDPK